MEQHTTQPLTVSSGQQLSTQLNEDHLLKILDDGNNDALFYLGLCCEKNDELKKAERYYHLSVEENKDTPSMRNLARLYRTSGHVAEAELFYKMAVRNNDSVSMKELGMMYHDEDRLFDAEKYYVMAFDRDVEGVDYLLASVYHDQGYYEYAEKYYLFAVEKNDVNGSYGLANLYYDRGIYDKAKENYQVAIRREHVDAAHFMALLLEEDNQHTLAEAYHLLSIKFCHNQNKDKTKYIKSLLENTTKMDVPFPWTRYTHEVFPQEFREKTKLLLLIFQRRTILRDLGSEVLFRIISNLSQKYTVFIQ
eukprot:TRINITY_DN1753_c0_g2_i1.p1 TRINITY_DN1753_c0_g2~~TRINITY_DN1753_c0_g2_i1.p1  ORF type:complete len:323 (+),score=48.27 TRINITY_DN1753_c0_g2_i1:51-971(+)